MYVRCHHVKSVKLLRDLEIDFIGADGEPRMWTVFVGENRLCKTTLLQTIAASACGHDRGTQLVTDEVASWPDLRDSREIEIETVFGFSEERHAVREYPDIPRPADPPRLRSHLTLSPDKRVFGGGSEYLGMRASGDDPLTRARSETLPDWFVAGYGPSRLLPTPGKTPRQSEPTLDRLRPLFGESLVGTGFIELLGEEQGRSFAKTLRSVFVEGGLLPHITGIELRGRGGIRSSKDLVTAQRFEMEVGDSQTRRIKVPAAWLSQGYQSLIAWVADFVGHILLEAGEAIEPATMEGVVLVDELDVHLHPTWQVRLIPALKRVFPRLQFIATTHSPMVLPALDASEVFLLTQDAEGSVKAQPTTRAPALLTGSELYNSFFDIQSLHPAELGEKMRRYGDLATDPTRTAAQDSEMIQLRKDLEAQGVEFDWEPVDREGGQ